MALIKQDLKRWKERQFKELLNTKSVKNNPANPPNTRKPKNGGYLWRVTTTVSSYVSRKRALKLVAAGEHVDPNPNCNFKKYGIKEPLDASP